MTTRDTVSSHRVGARKPATAPTANRPCPNANARHWPMRSPILPPGLWARCCHQICRDQRLGHRAGVVCTSRRSPDSNRDHRRVQAASATRPSTRRRGRGRPASACVMGRRCRRYTSPRRRRLDVVGGGAEHPVRTPAQFVPVRQLSRTQTRNSISSARRPPRTSSGRWLRRCDVLVPYALLDQVAGPRET